MIIIATNAFTSAYAQSDFFGKLIFLGLIFLSVVCWVVLSHKTWQTRKIQKISHAFKTALEKNQQQLLHLEIADLPKPRLKEIPHPFAEVFSALKQKSVDILNKNQFFLILLRKFSIINTTWLGSSRRFTIRL